MSTRLKLLIAVPVALIVLVVGGNWIYVTLIRDDPPEELSLDDLDDGTSDDSTGGTEGTAELDGAWAVGSGSQAGYRVGEVRLGASLETVGRTDQVTGEITIEGTSVTEGSFSVDLASIESDESLRDSQVNGRILETEQFPTAEFALTTPIELDALPADGEVVTVDATGDLTIHGVTQAVTIALEAQRDGEAINVSGSTPITWADYDIGDPSGGPNQVEDNGEMEFLLVFEPA
jgi:polyisoprenoid-binding protein YceI